MMGLHKHANFVVPELIMTKKYILYIGQEKKLKLQFLINNYADLV